jgi:hypothetical protein
MTASLIIRLSEIGRDGMVGAPRERLFAIE